MPQDQHIHDISEKMVEFNRRWTERMKAMRAKHPDIPAIVQLCLDTPQAMLDYGRQLETFSVIQAQFPEGAVLGRFDRRIDANETESILDMAQETAPLSHKKEKPEVMSRASERKIFTRRFRLAGKTRAATRKPRRPRPKNR